MLPLSVFLSHILFAGQIDTAAIPKNVGKQDAAVTIRALRAGLESWRQSVEFKSTFDYREGYAASIEAALQSGVDNSMEGPAQEVFKAKGVFNKLGRNQRFAIDFQRDPIEIDMSISSPIGLKQGKSRTVANLSFDEITDGRLHIRFEPGSSGNVVTVTRLEEDGGAGIHGSVFINPLRISTNPKFQPLKWGLELPKQSKAVDEQEVAQVDGKYLDIILRRDQGDGVTRATRQIRFLMAKSPPVITSFSSTDVAQDGNSQNLRVQFSDFQQCPGGLVARRVLYVFAMSSAKTRVKEWVSSDLGSVAPTSADFVLDVPPTAAIAGLKRWPAGDKIDLSRLNEIDLGTDVIRRLDSDASPLSDARSSVRFFSILLTITAVLVLSVVLTRYAMRRTRHGNKE